MPVKQMSLQAKPVFHPAADSPFFDLFEQNRDPSPEEGKMIQDLLIEKTAHLAHLNSQVPRRKSGKKIPRKLRAELDYTRGLIKRFRALISPWRRLPVEILSEIFLFTLKDRGDTEDDFLLVDDRAGTLLLCKICSAWRAVALRTPALWNTLSLKSCHLLRPLDWVSTWLDRSRASPVSLQLYWDSQLPLDIINSVISIFTLHLHHIAELAVEEAESYRSAWDPEHSHPKPTFRPLVESRDAPLLSVIHLELPSDSVLWDWIHALCRASPRVTQLTTAQFSLDSFPVVNLTDLYLGDPIPMLQVVQIFEHASNLQNVSFHVERPAANCSARALLGMKSVSNLEISSDDLLGEFLEQTEFPNLVDLGLFQIYQWPDDAGFRSFLSRSSCALTTLGFFGCCITQENIIASLQHTACNTLESLYVQECVPSIADALLQHLTYNGPERPLCNPKLSAIELHDIRAPDGLLSTMVESRLSATSSSSGPPAPTQLNVSFSFLDKRNQESDHKQDWTRLWDLEVASKGELEIEWPDVE
ncbi:hypothetical protein B0H12DRAFT_1241293 [Mycena haematopus]|nr:hypothetical protein B0H12DRAFT_1241293 [Mycena haematopus]